MSLIQNLINRVFWWRNPHQGDGDSESLESFIKKKENGIIELQQILVWDDCKRSLICVGVFNFMFGVMSFFQWRFYGLLFLMLLIAAVVEALNHHGQLGACRALTLSKFLPSPTAQPRFRVMPADEVSSLIRHLQSKTADFFNKMTRLRSQQPAVFCISACSVCVALGVLGRLISLTTLLYTLVMSILTLPGLFVRYPGFWKAVCSCCCSGLEADPNEEEDMLPEPTDSNTMRILSLEPEEHAATDPVVGESALYPDSMMSHDSSIDYLDPNVQLPSPRQIDQDLSDSDISEPHDIEFKSKFFIEDGGSSTSSGEELAKGLRFRGNVRRTGSSDSSDSFEIVSKDDL